MHAALSLAKQASEFIKERDFNLAIHRFAQSQAISPGPLALYGTAYCYLELKDYSKAISASHEALKYCSMFDDKVRIVIAKSYEGLGEYILANESWKTLENNTKSVELKDYSKQKQKRLEEILKSVEEFLEFQTKNQEKGEVAFIVCQNWMEKWKSWLFFNTEKPGLICNSHLIEEISQDPRDYARVLLKEGLIEGQDFSVVSWGAYKMLKDLHGEDQEIKRFYIPQPMYLEIETHLSSLSVLFCPSVSKDIKSIFTFKYSLKESIQEIISACKSFIEPSFDQISFNFDIFRIWKTENPQIDLKLDKVFLPSAELVSSFAPPQSPLQVFLFEFQKSDGNWTIFSEVESPCPSCSVLSELSFPCPICKTIKYCSQSCLDQHKVVHTSDCFQLIERSGKTGLKNLGNTCYMNSVIQCLSHTGVVKDYFLNKIYMHENPVSGPVTRSFARLLFSLWGANRGIVFPSEFKKAFCSKFKMFDGFSQHDSHEFLIHLLDCMNEEMKLPEDTKKLTFFGRNFFGLSGTVVECIECGFVREKEEEFLTLPLQVVNLEKAQVTFYMVFLSTEKGCFRRIIGSYFSWKISDFKEMAEQEFGCSVQLFYYDMLEFRGEARSGDFGDYVGKVIVGYEKGGDEYVVCSFTGPLGKVLFDRVFYFSFADLTELIEEVKRKTCEIFKIDKAVCGFKIQVFQNKEIVQEITENKKNLKILVEVLAADTRLPKYIIDVDNVQIDFPIYYNVYSGIRSFTNVELLDESNQWHCEKCGKKTNSKKQVFIKKTPKVLILQLMKFRNSLKKIDTFVDFPLEKLDLSEFGVSGLFDLFAVCNHYGSYMFGHYTAYIRSEESWFEINDALVDSIPPSHVTSSDAYLLFYVRR